MGLVDFTGAFTLHESAAGTVRVEPPDFVTLEGASFGRRRFRRSLVRECSAMVVSYYRERHDPSYVAPDDGAIVIRFEVEGMPRELLGPFVHFEGLGLADAVNLARRDLLFARAGFAASVTADGASVVISAKSERMNMSVPIPTADLVALVPRDDANVDAQYRIASGLDGARWLEVSLARGKPWLVGPFSPADAAMLVLAFRTWRADHPLDRDVTVVEERALRAEPARWHGRRVDVTGQWNYMFESSSFANVWLEPPEDLGGSYGSYRVRAIGTWIYPDAAADSGYGHMGCSPGMLRAESVEILEVLELLGGARDGLTGLPKRSTLDASFAREVAPAFALLDIDNLRAINQTHSYELGDEVIRNVAHVVARTLRAGDLAVRWAGDEVALVLPGASLDSARRAVGDALAAVRAIAILGDGAALRITCSAGLVIAAAGESLGAVARRAEDALFAARRAGRDRVVSG